MKIKNNHIKEAYNLVKNRKTMTAMLKEVWKGSFKMNFYTYALAVLAIVYTISPIDLLPDFIPVIGWVDDGILLFLLLQQLKKELDRYNKTNSANVIVLK